MQTANRYPKFVAAALLASLAGCSSGTANKSTLSPEQARRAALLDEIVEKTLAREAFSDVKNARLGIDIERDMRALRGELLEAPDDHTLLQVLVKLSNTRKDRHLRVGRVRDGLAPRRDLMRGSLPLEFSVHHERDGSRALFVSDLPYEGRWFATGKPAIGDTVVGVHGLGFDAWKDSIEPYLSYSTEAGLWVRLAQALTQRRAIWPDRLKPAEPFLVLRRDDGTTYECRMRWHDMTGVRWLGVDDPYYEGFTEVSKSATFDVYRFAGSADILLLRWYRFGPTLVEDIDRLMEEAEKNDWLDHDLILDCTRSRGGSRGAYAVQRLFPKPFKTTFGNLRISDAIPAFIAEKERQFAAERIDDHGTAETMDRGHWLMSWLREDVLPACSRGSGYTANVPFKLAHAPKDSDGVLHPANIHFRGRAVCLFGPRGGSHLDQFASIVVDNDLAHTIGMPTGGYSNTWEWEETLVMPETRRPLCRFMWSIGHTVRPNGEVLEGNPARVHDSFPTTRWNIKRYYPQMLDRALNHLASR